MGGSEPPPPPAKSNPNPKKPPVNPNWAQLQQKLNGGRGNRPKLSSTADAGDGSPATTVLGKRRERPDPTPEKEAPAPAPAARLLTPTSTDCSLTDTLAIDCEMVGVSSEGTKNALGRVTLVNTGGNVVYDEYVRPMDRVVDFRTKISGIHPRNLWKAKEFMLVQKEVAELIKGRILVGHALHNDLKALLLSHPKMATRDTSEYQPLLREAKRRALRDLAAEILGVKIQQGEHCPIEDARAVMLIYQKYKKKWEKNIKDQLKFKEKLKTRPRKKKKKPIKKDPTNYGVLPPLRSSQR